ncbi:hypothetical protein CC80DRAFT_33189 [Byssothecium circinans]|uniref:Uncharacterized protein n=1 Tax=Byssothecium circinans TaxID=147558 RepID=A0A6A5U1C4_9PLEO|nr:hypothetical protein CC80DRAFT_33189 [Byssothecium circinans]
MAPNLFVASQTLFQPRKWFRSSKSEKPKRLQERWEEPVPGFYEYIPRRGWFLIEKDKDITAVGSGADPKGGPVLTIEETAPKETIKVDPPVAVRYSKVLKRYLLSPDYLDRKKDGEIENSQGKKIIVSFFRLDDGVSWVNFLDEHGEFIPGPYRLWIIDSSSKNFRHMLRRDDPEYQRSQANSRVQSRQNSIDRDLVVRRHSQESRSTEYRGGGLGSIRDERSGSSTRASSIRGLTQSTPNSNAPSQANSRRGSFTRGLLSPRIPLDEAGVALRKLQKEQAAKETAAKQTTTSLVKKEIIEEPKTVTLTAGTPAEQPHTTPTPEAKESSPAVATSEQHQNSAGQSVAVGA